MQQVLVLDRNQHPLMPSHPARARQLLKAGRASVFRRFPFTIILHDREGGESQPVTLKVDPGSKTTGLALVVAGQRGPRVAWAAELQHRGHIIRERLTDRRAVRRSRRTRKTRYRPKRFDNRRRSQGWLPPSLQSRVANVVTWTRRLARYAPVGAVALEMAKFDTQAMQNPEIQGVEYQQGTLAGYEVREYLLEKWGRKCAYCGAANTPLEIEHIMPRSRGGSDRVSNLALACKPCNQRKGNQTAAEFGRPDVQQQAKQPLRDAAAVNVTRWALYRRLASFNLPLEVGSGGRTKYNRIRQGYPKEHWIDAACVGASGECVHIKQDHAPLLIKATGRQSRQMCRMDRYGFPRTSAKQGRMQFGFQTGDMVRANVPRGKYAGRHEGRVVVRARGWFPLGDGSEISWKHCRLVQRADGYEYLKGRKAHSSTP